MELQCDIPKLFEDRCGGSICHSAGESTAASLDLTSPGVEDRVSGAAGKSCVGTLADPASPETSLLYTKVADAPTCGTRMPLNGDPLTEDELACMRDWISGLLPPGGDGCENCACEPGVVESCYSGLEGTADVGICKSGMHTCQTSGMGFTACEGEVGPRGEDCFTADVDENCDGATPDCSETWVLGFGDPLSQSMRSAAFDSAGNVYGFGDFEGVVSFGGDPLTAVADKADLVITKHDHFGNPLWAKSWGDSSNQYGGKLIIDADDNLILLARIYGGVDFGGGLLSSKGSGDLIVAKLDSEGNHIWSHVYGDKDPERAERVVVDSQGDVIVTGTFTTSIDFGGGALTTMGMRDAFVVKLDGASGDYVFARQIGGIGDDYGFGIDVDASDNIVIAGRFQESLQIGDQLTSSGGPDIYLAKLAPSGTPMWARAFGGPGSDEVHDLKLQSNGDIVMIGGMAETMTFGGAQPLVSAGLRDIFITTLDSDGNHIWSSRHGDALDPFMSSFEVNSWMTLALGPDGSIHVSASLIGSLDFGGITLTASGDTNYDVFYFALADDGSYLGGSRYGGSGSDLMLDIAVNSTHALMAGRTHGSSIDFGAAGLIIAPGGGDGLLAKLPVP